LCEHDGWADQQRRNDHTPKDDYQPTAPSGCQKRRPTRLPRRVSGSREQIPRAAQVFLR
jgi:hypothetical protein